MRFLLRWNAPPRTLLNGAPGFEEPPPEESEREGADFGGKLLSLFKNMICTFAGRCDPVGDQARLALRLMRPGGNRREAARALQPFAVGFTRWLASEDDILTVEIPEQPDGRGLWQGSRGDVGRSRSDAPRTS